MVSVGSIHSTIRIVRESLKSNVHNKEKLSILSILQSKMAHQFGGALLALIAMRDIQSEIVTLMLHTLEEDDFSVMHFASICDHRVLPPSFNEMVTMLTRDAALISTLLRTDSIVTKQFTDIYNRGLVLSEMFSRRPFEANSAQITAKNALIDLVNWICSQWIDETSVWSNAPSIDNGIMQIEPHEVGRNVLATVFGIINRENGHFKDDILTKIRVSPWYVEYRTREYGGKDKTSNLNAGGVNIEPDSDSDTDAGVY